MKRLLHFTTPVLACLLLCLFLAEEAFSQVSEEWVRHYNGTANAKDEAFDIAADTLGNVYVTGRSEGTGSRDDYVTVKYDLGGNEIWTARYDGPRGRKDQAKAIAIDSLGNIYVTGKSEGSGTKDDYATIKYDSSGNELWVARYNSAANDKDGAEAIAIDSLGNIYVTGRSKGSTTKEDYATIKYDSSGNELWVARYNSAANDKDQANAIAIDSADNIYVTGKSRGLSGTDDYATIKYDSSGNELWVKRYNGPANDKDDAKAIAIDSADNIYVTGKSTGSVTNEDYATIKYDSSGNQLWVKRHNGPANDKDGAEAIAIDSLDNIYVTGLSMGSATTEDYATIKYDSSGNELWLKRYNGPANDVDQANAIAIDSSDNIYVTGLSMGNGTNEDFATIKYDSNGNELWVQRYNGSANDNDGANAITIDSLDNVVITGLSLRVNSAEDYTTIKYHRDARSFWVREHDGPLNDWDEAFALTTDSSENIYITGTSVGTAINTDFVTAKYDRDGNLQWVNRYDGPAGNWIDWDVAHDIVVDSSNNAYICGESVGIGTSEDFAMVKYDTNGNELWVRRYDSPGNGMDSPYAMVIDSAGSIYITGVTFNFSTWGDYQTVKYDTNGVFQWAKQYNGPGNTWDWALAIAIDSSDNIYVTGESEGLSGWGDYATVKYDTNGNELWVSRYDGPGNMWDWARAIVLDSFENIYVTGLSTGSGTSEDFATIKYDSNGNELWVRRYDGPPSGSDWGNAIAVDVSDNVYVTGRSPGVSSSDDFATVSYDSAGNQRWVQRYTSEGVEWDEPNAVAVDLSANVYVTGHAASDLATVKYDTNGNELWVKSYNGSANSWDEASDIVIDSPDNVCVTGGIMGDGVWGNLATMKYLETNTFVGQNQSVYLGQGVTVTFSEITVPGETGVSVIEIPPAPPTGFQVILYSDISTSTTYTGPITVTIRYYDESLTPPQEAALQLLHYEQQGGVWDWYNITDGGYPDTANNVIQGTTTSLSPFAIVLRSDGDNGDDDDDDDDDD